MMRFGHAILDKLVDYNAWRLSGADAEVVTPMDYVGAIARPDMVFAFADLFAPELTDHGGLKFLAARFSPQLFESWIQSGRTPAQAQQAMNHVHISTLLQNQELSDEMAIEIAKTIVELWQLTLGPQGVKAQLLGNTFDRRGSDVLQSVT